MPDSTQASTPLPWRVQGRVIKPGQVHGDLDAKRAGACHVIEHDGNYLMTYWGTDTGGQNHILAASAPIDRPNDWTPLGPWLSAQPDTEHNCVGPGFPFLLPVEKNYWLLYFCGWGRPTPERKLPNTTGAAVSHDQGKTWQYLSSHPVIALDKPYDHNGTGSLWVRIEQNKFRAWYTAIGDYFPKPANVQTGHGDTIPLIGIGYAESTDGVHWTKPLDTLCVTPRGHQVEPYEYIVSKPGIIHDGKQYTLWVNTFGTAYRVHRLTSSDGVNWAWAPRLGPDGELPPAAPDTQAFDDKQRSYPCILQHNGHLRCWYTGNNFGTHGMGYAQSL
jgi:hypothetical protein